MLIARKRPFLRNKRNIKGKDAMKTVRETLQDRFCSRYHVSWEELPACLQFALQEVERRYHSLWQQVAQEVNEEEQTSWRAEIERVLTCWDRDAGEYSAEWLYRVQQKVVDAAFTWYVMRYNEQKAVMQEIFRLSHTMLPHQEQESQQVVLFQDEMEEVLRARYGLSPEEAHACFAACRPDFRREFLELRLIDTQGRLLSGTTCPQAEFDAAIQVVDFLVCQWIEHRQSHPPH
jgi:hypothetical protein